MQPLWQKAIGTCLKRLLSLTHSLSRSLPLLHSSRSFLILYHRRNTRWFYIVYNIDSRMRSSISHAPMLRCNKHKSRMKLVDRNLLKYNDRVYNRMDLFFCAFAIQHGTSYPYDYAAQFCSRIHLNGKRSFRFCTSSVPNQRLGRRTFFESEGTHCTHVPRTLSIVCIHREK